MVAPSATIEILRRRRAFRRQEAAALRARRRIRILASGALACGFAVALVLVISGLAGAGSPPASTAGGVAGASLADVAPDADVLSTLVVGARANRSVVTVEAGGVRTGGFVAWRDASHSYVLLPHATALDVLRAGGRDVDVAVRGDEHAGRIVAARGARGLAVVRVRGDLGEPLLGRPIARLRAGDPAVVAAGSGTDRSQAVVVAPGVRGELVVSGEAISSGAPVLAIGGAVAAIVAENGDDARVVTLAGCRTLRGCFPRLAR